jgi:5-methylcytosine-specific restriction enzyme A
MNTYLFAWNPQKWEWKDIDEDINELHKTGRLVEKWSCASHRQVRVGDRAFLVKVGSEHRGVFASGFVASPPFVSPHWDGSDRTVHDVLVEIDTLVNPYISQLLGTDRLHPKERWTPQSSGVRISVEAAEDLEKKWFEFLNRQGYSAGTQTKEAEKATTFIEGASRDVIQTFRERNPYARKVCLEEYGYTCQVCCFDFVKQYGLIGKEFIHVHHLNMVSSKKGEYELNPVEDLRPVCPNCHAMIHKKNPPYSIEEMKELINTSFCAPQT